MVSMKDGIGAFSFSLDGVPFAPSNGAARATERGADMTYDCPGGLRVTQSLIDHGDAFSWTMFWENVGSENTAVVSDIRDCDLALPLPGGTKPTPGWMMPADNARVFYTVGGDSARDDFNSHPAYLPEGATQRYAPNGGRSSNGRAPFFDVNRGEAGYLVAIGWTGQWNAAFVREGGDVRVRIGLEDAAFYVKPGERVRTCEILILPYAAGQDAAHNAFRRLIKRDYAILGKPGRPEHPPLELMLWGGVSSDKLIEHIDAICDNGLSPDIFWIDAGWYGYSTGPCPNEHVGDWHRHTGSWTINPTYHPDGLVKVRAEMRKYGVPFLLWVEPERVIRGTDSPKAHPDWYLEPADGGDTLLIDYGNEDALMGTFDMLANLIETLEIGVYRQDFNTEPLPYWRKYDEPGRRGMREIKHIMGLYRLWDMLLAKFPHLYIDNCSSGGRRIDIETLKRSVPLWRSDYQCTFDADPETSQCHMNGFSWWLPYSGTGAGAVLLDTYRTRSCYSAAMGATFWYQAHSDPDPATFDWARATFAEYRRAKEFFEADFYQLTPRALDDACVMAAQYDRPERGDGMVIVFRRPDSVCDRVRLPLKALEGEYEFECSDRGGKRTLVWDADKGFEVELPEPRSSRLFFYRKTDARSE